MENWVALKAAAVATIRAQHWIWTSGDECYCLCFVLLLKRVVGLIMMMTPAR
jgi:hypothetical protein